VEVPLIPDSTTDWEYEASSVYSWYEHSSVEVGVGGRANPSVSFIYSIFGADFVSLLGINSFSE
jgi:hypothetical protein